MALTLLRVRVCVRVCTCVCVRAGLLSFWSFFILLSLLVPISLYVTIELIKIVISVIITSDREMYAVEDDQVSLARSRYLCEELGQVS